MPRSIVLGFVTTLLLGGLLIYLSWDYLAPFKYVLDTARVGIVLKK